MVYSHCLICGTAIFTGLYCKDCEWEIKRIRLGSEDNFDLWLSNVTENEKVRHENYDGISLEKFSNLSD